MTVTDTQQVDSVRQTELLDALRDERARIGEILLGRQLSLLLDVDLTIQQLKIVLIVVSGMAQTGRDIASRLHVSAPTVSAAVERLVEVGYLHREPDLVDRRVTRLHPTAAAVRLRNDLIGAREVADEVLRELDHESLASLLQGTRALRVALTTVSGDAVPRDSPEPDSGVDFRRS
jgi:DNA-binding MarR family transcriptional regulator